MPAPWKRMYVETYGPDGARERWDVLPPEGSIIDDARRDSMLEQLRQPNPDYPDAHVEWADCGTDLVFGYFYGGVRPTPGGPKHLRSRDDEPPPRPDVSGHTAISHVPPPPE